jgi:transcriptional regulator with PAS, ATPase and Fis domain
MRPAPSAAQNALARLVGDSHAMKEVRAWIQRVSSSPAPKLILGETGTGKELCAAAIAQLSGVRPYVTVNCAAIPDTLVESEFFGYERGAFTGANHTHHGLIAQANGGLLFLDELADISRAGQAKLLRALESGEYRLLGSNRLQQSSFRIVAATSGDLAGLVAKGRLRADLMYRLGSLRIILPPLRKREEDIPALAETILRQYDQRAATVHILTKSALDLLRRYPWPGNVRELKNVIEAAAALAGRSAGITAKHVAHVLPPDNVLPGSGQQKNGSMPTLEEAVASLEARVISEALRRCRQVARDQYRHTVSKD